MQPTNVGIETRIDAEDKTIPITVDPHMDGPTIVDPIVCNPIVSNPIGKGTFIGPEDSSDLSMSNTANRELVGWLVSYTLDKKGVDFKLYEGRNIIGRDMDCNIIVNDNMISKKHAVLLYRADKYSITDLQSTHGTFVNGEDIELNPRYLKDGDIIKMGRTTFLFRTSKIKKLG